MVRNSLILNAFIIPLIICYVSSMRSPALDGKEEQPFVYSHNGMYQKVNPSPHDRFRRATLMSSPALAPVVFDHEGNKEKFVNSSVAARGENERNTENTVVEDHHKYYTSKYLANASAFSFVDLSSGHAVRSSGFEDLEVSKLTLLSGAYLKADTVKLKFPFHFYGNEIRSVVVTTGGFLSVGPIFHAYSHVVHYVAPLMANFNPSMTSNENDTSSSGILIGSGKDVFIVQWNELRLNNTHHDDDGGDMKFTFQAILHSNGTIVFAYKDIPMSPSKLENSIHNVTIGLADGLVLSYVYRKDDKFYFHNYIYSYHKVALPLEKASNGGVFVLDLQPTCVQQNNCTTCLDKSATQFTCKWCPKLQLCSDGIDWHRQAWLKYCAGHSSADSSRRCFDPDGTDSSTSGRRRTKGMTKRKSSDRNNTGALIGGIIGFLCLAGLLALLGFLYYAYTRPQSTPGMWLIEHRPSVVFRKARMMRNDKDSDDQLL